MNPNKSSVLSNLVVAFNTPSSNENPVGKIANDLNSGDPNALTGLAMNSIFKTQSSPTASRHGHIKLITNDDRRNNTESSNSSKLNFYDGDNNRNNYNDDTVKPKPNQKIKFVDEPTVDINPDMLNTLSNISIKLQSSLKQVIQNNKIENLFPDQDFHRIKERYSRQNPFYDHEFPPSNHSIHYSKTFRSWLENENKIHKCEKNFTWKRARDLCRSAQFVVDNKGKCLTRELNETNYKDYFSTTDLDQGSLGNCWFISAATGIIQNFKLLKTVVPFDNSFDDEHYTGAFHFRFWMYGKWKEVVVDDYLPVGLDNHLIFCKNREHVNEFWCALLEKAYAKLCGSYESLEGGFTSDALIDMSGGIEEVFELHSIKRTINSPVKTTPVLDKDGGPIITAHILWDILTNARRKSSVIGCSIELKESSTNLYNNEVKLTNGLVMGHAYVVTKLATLDINGEIHRIIRLYNPWGNDAEWNGDWSDRSKRWNQIHPDTKQALELRVENDGEFWMPYNDWLVNFDVCQICNLSPETICEINEEEWHNQRLLSNIFSMWQCQYFHGQWIAGECAGGSGQHRPESDMVKNNRCWVIVALMQKYTRGKRQELQVSSAEEYIQYRLFKIRELESYVAHIAEDTIISPNEMVRVGSSGAYINKREVTHRFSLEPGAYVIIPSIYEENREGDFLLRIFTERPLTKKHRLSSRKVKSSSISDQAKVIGTILQFTDDFRKRNIELRNNEDFNNTSASGSNVETKFLARKKSIIQPSAECKQM